MQMHTGKPGALQSLRRLRTGALSYGLGWWAFTFALGESTVATLALTRARDTHLEVFGTLLVPSVVRDLVARVYPDAAQAHAPGRSGSADRPTDIPPARKDINMTGPPKTYHVRAESSAGGRATIDAGNQRIQVDASWGSAEPPGLPGPAELLAGAFAACLMKNIERSSALLSFRYRRVEIDVQARRQDAPPCFAEIDYEVRIVTDEEDRRIDLLHRNLRQFGTVYNTLAAACDVHGRIITVPPSDQEPEPKGR